MSQHDDNSDDVSGTAGGEKSPYSEATVVHSSNRPVVKKAEAPVAADPDRTVIHAQSNLKEAFDARTVVQVAKPPKGVAEPKREVKSEFKKPEYPKPELPKEAPVSVSEASYIPAAHIPEETGGAIEIRPADHTQTSMSDRRAMRASLDRKTRFMIAGFAAAASLGLAFMFMGNGATNDASAPVAAHSTKSSVESAHESEMASTSELDSSADSQRPTKVAGVTQSGTTTDVLARFERAATRAQEKAAPGR